MDRRGRARGVPYDNATRGNVEVILTASGHDLG